MKKIILNNHTKPRCVPLSIFLNDIGSLQGSSA